MKTATWSSKTSNTITVDNVPPTVTVGGEPGTSIPEGTAVALTSTATEPGPGGYTYLWTMTKGSGSFSLTGNASATTSALNFTPVAAGTYVATLQVTDSEGGVTSREQPEHRGHGRCADRHDDDRADQPGE